MDIINNNKKKDKNDITNMLRAKIMSLLKPFDDFPVDNRIQILNVEDYPLEMPETLAKDFFDYLTQLFTELKGPDAPIEKLTDSQSKYLEYALRYKADSEIAFQDAQNRTFFEKVMSSNNEDIKNYIQAQRRYAEYLLRALAKDFIEEMFDDDSFIL